MRKYYGSLKSYLRDGGRPSDLNCPCAGPYASVSGMRSHYWGKNCVIVKRGKYIYRVR